MSLQTSIGLYIGEVSGLPLLPNGKGALFNDEEGVVSL
jgi:hypothetical protein